MKIKGFTIIEVLIATCILIVTAAILIPAISGRNRGNQTVETEVSNLHASPEAQTYQIQCVEGFKFVVSPNGQLTQVLSYTGSGIICPGH